MLFAQVHNETPEAIGTVYSSTAVLCCAVCEDEDDYKEEFLAHWPLHASANAISPAGRCLSCDGELRQCVNNVLLEMSHIISVFIATQRSTPENALN